MMTSEWQHVSTRPVVEYWECDTCALRTERRPPEAHHDEDVCYRAWLARVTGLLKGPCGRNAAYPARGKEARHAERAVQQGDLVADGKDVRGEPLVKLPQEVTASR